MRKVCLLLLMLLPLSLQAIELKGQMTQGSMIVGKVEPGTLVWLDDKPLKVAANGEFLFAFSREAELSHTLSWQQAGEDKQSQSLALKKREYKIDRIDGLPPKMVTPDPKVIARIREEGRRISKARTRDDDRTDFAMDFIWPAKGRISGVYGSQRVLNGKPKNPHYGVDIANKVGTAVVAPADGIVTFWMPDMYYSGGTMLIDHGHGITSAFLHLSKSEVKVGDMVKQGQLVARIGKTGRATGPHLDWRMNWFKVRFDPQLLVKGKP
ncbi:M23 family metallopeptidase [Neptunicella marina]|uniref:M23 family metallopeptidase n=1 Tax=Neptunicella marina TaxID=2125989 RepID=A0A8J6M0D1_9ALTE|nr:M23 family metallopeptidase [Neptunicella marina]MBC3764603.1 M23 family metallopeptidase [Neptunicella marina]